MATALDGTIRYHKGDRAGGIARVRNAVSAADHIEFEYGPPWSAKPLDELLGELLLADGQRNEAATAFENTLAVYPNRRLAREGWQLADRLDRNPAIQQARPDKNSSVPGRFSASNW
jgi:hypothetical protein